MTGAEALAYAQSVVGKAVTVSLYRPSASSAPELRFDIQDLHGGISLADGKRDCDLKAEIDGLLEALTYTIRQPQEPTR